MLEWFNPWGWLIAALVLAAAELAAPGAVFLWLAIAAGVTALLVAVFDPSWPVQLTIYALLAIASVILGRRFFRWKPIATTAPGLNRRADQMVGQIYVLIEPIKSGQGKALVADSPWLVSGPDLPKGAAVRVLRVEGAKLIVEAANS
jgi:inner membrane protein